MGVVNVLVEGVSGSGKTSVCRELQRRGHDAYNGDTDLAYQGDPVTGEPWHGAPSHWNHVWRVADVERIVADRSHPLTFLCGGSRNHASFVGLLDAVVVLTLDAETLARRLDARPGDEFGARPEERALVLDIHRAGDGLPGNAIAVDATAPLGDVVDEIVRIAESRCTQGGPA